MKKSTLLLIAITFLITGCKQETLLEGLNQEQANEVVAVLQKNNIDVKKSPKQKEGFSVLVSNEDFSYAVDIVTQYDLPSRARNQIADYFPSDSLVSSPRAEVAKIYSAIEQRLEHTLAQMQNIVSASVHVSYNVSNIDSTSKPVPVHIAALLKHDQDIADKEVLLTNAKRLLKNSFNEVSYDNISVILTKIEEISPLSPTPRKTGFKIISAASGAMLIIMLIVVMGGLWLLKKRKESRALQ